MGPIRCATLELPVPEDDGGELLGKPLCVRKTST